MAVQREKTSFENVQDYDNPVKNMGDPEAGLSAAQLKYIQPNQESEQSQYKESTDDYQQERAAISDLIGKACADRRMKSLRSMMDHQAGASFVDHQNIAELAQDLIAVVQATRDDMAENRILSHAASAGLDYYEQTLKEVESAHLNGEFQSIRRNEALLLQGIIVHFDTGYGNGHPTDSPQAHFGTVHHEVYETAQSANILAEAMGYGSSARQTSATIADFAERLAQKLEEQSKYLRGNGRAGGIEYTVLNERLELANCNLHSDSLGEHRIYR